MVLSLLVSFGDGRNSPPLLCHDSPRPSPSFLCHFPEPLLHHFEYRNELFWNLYIGFLLSHVSLIRNLPDGKPWALFLIVAIWVGDISAFVSGSLLGRHKLYPRSVPRRPGRVLSEQFLGRPRAPVFCLDVPTPPRNRPVHPAWAQSWEFSPVRRSHRIHDQTERSGEGLRRSHSRAWRMLDRLDSFLFSAPFLHYSLLYLLKEAP